MGMQIAPLFVDGAPGMQRYVFRKRLQPEKIDKNFFTVNVVAHWCFSNCTDKWHVEMTRKEITVSFSSNTEALAFRFEFCDLFEADTVSHVIPSE